MTQPTAAWRQNNFEGRIREALYRSGFVVPNSYPEDDTDVEQFERDLWNLGLAIVEMHNPRCECPCHDAETAAYERDENLHAFHGCRRCTTEVEPFHSRSWWEGSAS